MAIGTIAVVLISVVGSLTFLPATLAILGDGVNRGRIPFLGRERPEGSGVWATIVRAVMRRPVISFLVSGGLLVVLALPVARLHLGTGDFSSFPDSLDIVQAVNLANAKYPTGVGLDFNVVVTDADQQATKDAIAKLGPAISAIPGIGGPADVVLAADGKTASVNFKMKTNGNGHTNGNGKNGHSSYAELEVSYQYESSVATLTGALDPQLSEMMGDAPFCDNCGYITVRNGSCYRCLNCGNSLGCS